MKNASKAQNFSREDFTRKTGARQLRKFLSKFCVLMFCLNPFLREEFSHELLAKMPLKEFFDEKHEK